MKRAILYIVLLLSFASYATAQKDYHNFKFDVGMLIGDVSNHHVGLCAPYVEPKFNINNSFTVGLRMEYVFYSKEDFIKYDPEEPYLSDFDADGWTFSVVPTIDYYFNDHFIRPFVGIGGGIYYMFLSSKNSFVPVDEKIASFGYVPRIGLNVGQFRISCEYNAILSKEVDLSYVSFKLGYEIGGGKKWF